jgi:hypothetical protein
MKPTIWEAEVRRFLCGGNILDREVIGGILARSERLDVEGLGLWMLEGPSGETIGVGGLPNDKSHRMMQRCRFSRIGSGPKHTLVLCERQLDPPP